MPQSKISPDFLIYLNTNFSDGVNLHACSLSHYYKSIHNSNIFTGNSSSLTHTELNFQKSKIWACKKKKYCQSDDPWREVKRKKKKKRKSSNNNFRPFITKILGNFSSGLQAYNSNDVCNWLAPPAQPDVSVTGRKSCGFRVYWDVQYPITEKKKKMGRWGSEINTKLLLNVSESSFTACSSSLKSPG